jgi:hypothetical protein
MVEPCSSVKGPFFPYIYFCGGVVSFGSLGFIFFLLRTLNYLPVCLDSTFHNLTEPIGLWDGSGLGVGVQLGVSDRVSNSNSSTAS